MNHSVLVEAGQHLEAGGPHNRDSSAATWSSFACETYSPKTDKEISSDLMKASPDLELKVIKNKSYQIKLKCKVPKSSN